MIISPKSDPLLYSCAKKMRVLRVFEELCTTGFAKNPQNQIIKRSFITFHSKEIVAKDKRQLVSHLLCYFYPRTAALLIQLFFKKKSNFKGKSGVRTLKVPNFRLRFSARANRERITAKIKMIFCPGNALSWKISEK